MTQRLGTAIMAAIIGVCLLLALAMLWHVYQDHLWDDQMRMIQKQSIQQMQQQQAKPEK